MPETTPGVNIQWPWSQLIVSGKKTVETRSYKLPSKYVGRKLAIIETPGPRGKAEAGFSKARIVGTVVFSGSFRYSTRDSWMKDFSRHCVEVGDHLFAFDESQEKWGWVISEFEGFVESKPAPVKRGIVFATCCEI